MTASGLAYSWTRTDSGGPAPAGPAGGQTVAVTRTDLSQQKSLPGTLGFGRSRTVKGRGSGTVTWLPKQGATLDRGGQLARVDDRPVTVFTGDMPLYRTLGAPTGEQPGRGQERSGDGGSGSAKPEDAGSGSAKPGDGAKPGAGPASPSAPATPGTGAEVAGPGAKGSDVRLLEENLYALGYRDFGRPDDKLTDATVTAIQRWQKSLGIADPTGRVAPGDVEVLPGKFRVGQVKAQPGDGAGEDLLVLTGTEPVVTVPMPVSDLSLAGKGSQVTLTLPDGRTTKGKVTEAGTVATGQGGGQGGSGDGNGDGAQGGGSGQAATVQVTVALEDPSTVGRLEGAPVSADFVSESRKGVLTVPVGALVALREGGYALQLPAPQGQGDDRRAAGRAALVPVKTGMFAKGLVEVSGAGVKEGMKVVSTA